SDKLNNYHFTTSDKLNNYHFNGSDKLNNYHFTTSDKLNNYHFTTSDKLNKSKNIFNYNHVKTKTNIDKNSLQLNNGLSNECKNYITTFNSYDQDIQDDCISLTYPLINIDNQFLSVLFSMWQHMEILYFSKLDKKHLNKSSNNKVPTKINVFKPRTPNTIVNFCSSNTTSDDYNNKYKLNHNTAEATVFKNVGKHRILEREKGEDTTAVGTKVDTEEETSAEYSIDYYLKCIVFDIFECDDEEKEININDFLILFEKLNMHCKRSVINTTWCVITGCKNMNEAIKKNISIAYFIKKAYSTNPSLIFFEYCKTKIKLRELEKSVKMLQSYNKKIVSLIRK
ncbi:hypothetical protein HEP_00339200, partial [Hepatocystis sp. ex Piliocolobus tephrosceles]